MLVVFCCLRLFVVFHSSLLSCERIQSVLITLIVSFCSALGSCGDFGQLSCFSGQTHYPYVELLNAYSLDDWCRSQYQHLLMLTSPSQALTLMMFSWARLTCTMLIWHCFMLLRIVLWYISLVAFSLLKYNSIIEEYVGSWHNVNPSLPFNADSLRVVSSLLRGVLAAQ